ncbi:hypothetical protein RN001_013205 [Aquatica leii]|uniref:Putative inorganic phosphate cotransporter n=1 Tax=Aquatica leii TaxID=1421715 RepID=A0AAN7PZP6_9COLE|nr:hypothetical protein RN001_013205 [Aquatica leii]
MGSLKSNNKEHDKSSANTKENLKPDLCYGARHTQIILMFLLISLGYMMRVALSVGIVAMTDPNASPNPDIPTYEWDDESIILSSFFLGYMIPQIGAGQLAKYYGPKYFLAGATAIGSVISILIPVMAQFGSWAIIICRVLQGIAQGFMYPSCHHLLSKWTPPSERSRFSTFVYAGTSFGTVISLPLTGWISGSSLGWPFAYYLYGALGLLWTVVWLFLGKNSPKEHKKINPLELKYIETSLNETHDQKPMATPWKAIFSSLPFWGIFVGQCGQNWGYTTLLTNIPTYMGNVLNFDIKSNGLLSAGPYFTFWILSFISSYLADWAITHRVTSIGNTRKIANSIGAVVPAIALIILGVIGTTSTNVTTGALILLFIAVGVNSSTCSGYQVNHMDIAPVHAGTLMGISNGLSNVTAIIAPLIIQFIVTEASNPYQWATVFYTSAAIFIAGNVIFVVFGSGETQSWNYAKNHSSEIHTDFKVQVVPNERKESIKNKF